MPPPTDLKNKMFFAGGSHLDAQRELSKFQCFRDPLSGNLKLIIELTIQEPKKGELLREFTEFNTTEDEVIKKPGWVFFQGFDQANPLSEAIDSAKAIFVHDKNDIVRVSADVVLKDGGKTQSGF